MKRAGPNIQMTQSCSGCRFNIADSYEIQSDSGFTVSCGHPDHGQPGQDRRRIGDTTWHTPSWCPLLPAALAAFAATLT